MGWLYGGRVQRALQRLGRCRDLSKVYSHITQGGDGGGGSPEISVSRSQEPQQVLGGLSTHCGVPHTRGASPGQGWSRSRMC